MPNLCDNSSPFLTLSVPSVHVVEKETLRGVFPEVEPTARALPRVCRIREIFSSVPPLFLPPIPNDFLLHLYLGSGVIGLPGSIALILFVL